MNIPTVPNSTKNVLLAVKTALIAGGTIYLYVEHKIDAAVASAILVGLGGTWAGVGGVLKSIGSTAAATTPTTGAPPVDTSPTQASPGPIGAGHGPDLSDPANVV